MPQSVTPFVGQVPDYEIIEKNMHITAGEFAMCMSLRTFQLGMARAQRVIDAHYAKKAAVVPFRR